MLCETYRKLCMQRLSFSNRKQFPDQPRQTQRTDRRKHCRTQRDRPDHRSVGIDRSAELQGQKHRRPARQRRGKQDKRDRLQYASRPAKQRKGKQQKARQFAIRLAEQRYKKQGCERIACAEQRNEHRRADPDPNAHPCRCKQIYTAVHQRIVYQERFNCDLHATEITMTVMSSVPPLAFAIIRSCSPVF